MELAGQRIKQMRLAAGMSQTELGSRIGVSKQQIMRYETKGVQNMRVRRIVALCKVFGCTPNDLLERGGE